MAKITKERIGLLLQAALKAVDEAGGALPSKEVLPKIAASIKLTDYEKEVYEKSGYVRWESVVHFYSIDCAKAGWLKKNSGVWYITEEGKQALKKYPPEQFIIQAGLLYRKWSDSRTDIEKANGGSMNDEPSEQTLVRQTAFEDALSSARQEIVSYIDRLDGYEFQDLVGALLRAMKFYTPFIAPKGKDGGLDIIAYNDPLGVQSPRLKVQVKHREQKVDVKEVREFISLLHDGDVGIIVSSGGFTSDAEVEMRRSPKHIDKIDTDRFIELWEQHYDNMRDDDRVRLPLKRISFLAPVE